MIFRTKAQYMATQYLSSALQKIEDNLYEEVGLLAIVYCKYVLRMKPFLGSRGVEGC